MYEESTDNTSTLNVHLLKNKFIKRSNDIFY